MGLTIISWVKYSFNIIWGCMKISTGCEGCYAKTKDDRWHKGQHWGPKSERLTFGEKYWEAPLRWNKEAERAGKKERVFTSSMGDVFEDHPTVERERAKLWPLIRATPWLDWLILTKRADRIADSLPDDWGAGYPNVWFGVSIENQDYLWRMEALKQISARVHFLSLEPLLEPLGALDLTGIHWVIVGGESGPHFRPMPHAWAREIRDQCVEQGVAFFFKQSAALRTEQGTELEEEDGSRSIWHQFPKL